MSGYTVCNNRFVVPPDVRGHTRDALKELVFALNVGRAWVTR